ncbi:hypothetical protein A6R68_03842, partial [Neotoma lepida]
MSVGSSQIQGFVLEREELEQMVRQDRILIASEELKHVPDSMKHEVVIIGKIYTPMEYKGKLALYDMQLWLKLELVANVVPVKALPGYTTQPSKLFLMVQNPFQFDELMMPKLYRNIIDNLAASLVRGAGVVLTPNMLRHLSLEYHSSMIQKKVTKVGKVQTQDLGPGLLVSRGEQQIHGVLGPLRQAPATVNQVLLEVEFQQPACMIWDEEKVS